MLRNRLTPLSSQLALQKRFRAISSPVLVGIEKRWDKMSEKDQEDLYAQLEERQRADWSSLTMEEKKALYYINFGEYGPRTRHRSKPGSGWKVLGGTLATVGVGAAIFTLARSLAPPAPKTMTKEWQEASNEYMKEHGIEPISGPGGKDYKGPGMVSWSSGAAPEKEEE